MFYIKKRTEMLYANQNFVVVIKMFTTNFIESILVAKYFYKL